MSFCWFPKTANYFYPHPPRGGRHKTTVPCLGRVIFLSTPSARRATDRQKHSSRTFTISIHALREEGDGMCWGFPRRRPKFLSTPSARRATISGAEHRAHGTDFYPRPPRGGRRDQGVVLNHDLRISIHALREEGDVIRASSSITICEFLSTPSARRATNRPRHHRRRGPISIHALREEGDVQRPAERRRTGNFYPRPPRGGRLGATCKVDTADTISIHALREEGDCSKLSLSTMSRIFLSTPSARRATMQPSR